MRTSSVFIEAVGSHLPTERVSSAAIEDALEEVFHRWKIPRGQLQAMTGIQERRFWPRGVSLAEKGADAVQDALALCHVPSESIGLMIYASVCREAREPATANLVAARLAERNVALSSQLELFDLSNACLGAFNAMLSVARRIETGEIRAGVVVVCESAREITAMAIEELRRASSIECLRLNLATLTGGSGAAAVILSDGSFSPYSEQSQLLGGVVGSEPQHAGLCRWEVAREEGEGPGDHFGGPYRLVESMRTDSVALLNHGVGLGTRTFAAFLDSMRWTIEDIDLSIGHQVGKVHQDKILQALGIAPQAEHCSYPELGNTGSAAVLLTLADALQQGRLDRGHKVALLGIGSGLNCMMMGVQW